MVVEASIGMAWAAAVADDDMVSHIDRVEYHRPLEDVAADSCA